MHKSDRRSLLFLVSLFVIIAALTGFFADTEYSNDTPTFLLTASCTNSHHNIRLMQLTCMLCQSAMWKRSASTRIQPTALRCCVLDFSHGKFATFINSAPVVAFTNARKTLPTYMGLPPKTTSAWLLTYASRATIFLPHLWLR